MAQARLHVSDSVPSSRPRQAGGDPENSKQRISFLCTRLPAALRSPSSAPVPSRMRVHLIQFDIAWEQPARNRERVMRLLRDAESAGRITPGDLIILPEMFDTGFSFNTDVTADRDGASVAFLRDTAGRLGAYVVGGITALDTPPASVSASGSGSNKLAKNRAIIAGPDGRLLGTYDKRRLFSFGVPSEAMALTPGAAPALFEWRSGEKGSDHSAKSDLKVSPLICYDLRFPELFHDALQLGAQAFIVIANWPVARAYHWRTLLIARAIENQAFIFAVNRTGSDPTLAYPGWSMAIDPKGEILAEGDDRERIVSAEIDISALHTWRRVFPAWRDRGGID